MDHFQATGTVSSPAEALARVMEGVRSTLAEAAFKATTMPRLVRVEAAVADVDPLAWLRAQPGKTQYYWSDREDAFAMAGVGEADVLEPAGPMDLPAVFRLMRRRLGIEYPAQRYYGGLRFSSGPTKGERWKHFKDYRFVAPRFEVCRHDGVTRLACNLLLDAAGDHDALLKAVEAAAAQISWAPPPPAGPVQALQRTDTPDHAGWRALVEEALDACAAHAIEKVVLARESCFQTATPLDPVALLEQLQAHTARGFAFCFHPAHDRAFIGVSPELLFRRKNVFIESEALAGTRPRGRTEAEDTALSNSLLGSDKDLREHRFVLRMVREHFRRFCVAFQEAEAPGIMTLRHCQHLHTTIEGVLKDNLKDAALLEAFHPTPAVGGAPRDKALAWLAEKEPFDRGIYAAPVGWVGYDASEFSVGIRSALVQQHELCVYTGAGIVPGSDPEEEWAEIENKMGAFREILGQ